MKILELFSGTASFSNVAKQLGYETLTIDNNPIFEPDICEDILELKNLNFKPDVIWASPPCQCFSVATIGKNWFKDDVPKTKTTEALISLRLVAKTISLIAQLFPTYWFIENPRGMLRKLIDPYFNTFGLEYKRNTVTYCQYGDTRMKPTDIWTNCFEWIPRQPCKNGDNCHDKAPRGTRQGTQGLKNSIDRAKVPEELCMEILKSLQKYI